MKGFNNCNWLLLLLYIYCVLILLVGIAFYTRKIMKAHCEKKIKVSLWIFWLGYKYLKARRSSY